MNNQMNSAVRKIHNLQSSGAVTVTGLNQPRVKKVGATTVTTSNSLQNANASRCYVCDDLIATGQGQGHHQLTEMLTSHTSTKFPNKIGQLVGDTFMVIVSVEDVVCSRCTNLINYLDRLENDVERVRTNLMNLLHKKYGLNDEGGGGGGNSVVTPPFKMHKLNSGIGTRVSEDVAAGGDLNRNRKMLHTPTGGDLPVGKQSPPVSAVQQIKITTIPVQQQTSAAGTQTLQRKTTKIYKCPSCDYKTSDMRLFNSHYETCKQQNFQCKNCKKIFPNFGAMKMHMVREHSTAMDHTCAVCHINFVNDAALRKHMEMNHSTSVVVTSTTTLPGGVALSAADTIGTVGGSVIGAATSTPLYSCNHCQFKSTDKVLFDEHMRKHLAINKPKPFKCRLCAQRFETREAATVHAKQHQPNYFKCGTCSASFPKRELLVKHFEVHQQQQQNTTTTAHQQPQVAHTPQSQSLPSAVGVKVQQQQTTQPAQNMLTQKLLQDTIEEALSENVSSGGGPSAGSTEAATAAANNIIFFSCHICSLTFLQENYYNQHMETHRLEKKPGVVITGAATNVQNTTTTAANSVGQGSVSAASAAGTLHSDGTAKGVSGNVSVSAVRQANAAASAAEADIESIFEKMHSDKSDLGVPSADTQASSTASTNAAAAKSADNMIISQEGSGGITINITIPQADATGSGEKNGEVVKSKNAGSTPMNVSIDMPTLDQPDEAQVAGSGGAKREVKSDVKQGDDSESNQPSGSGPVSMPSLDDDNDSNDPAKAQSTAPTTTQATAEAAKANEIKMEIGVQEGGNSAGAKASDHKATVDSTGAESGAEVDIKHEDGEEVAPTSDEGDVGAAGESEAATQEQLVANAAGEHVAMELDEAMQAQVEGGQIKFILNENGQLLQLDNHIITDADGNQILVQDPEQIHQLLQSVGVLQSGDGLDGETLQMMTDANGQMVLVQGENNEAQLIDASLLNADGQLVIQQGHDGDLGEGAHVIGEDGRRIPVSVSYTADGQPIVQVQQQVMEAGEAGGSGHVVLEKDGSAVAGAGGEGSQQGADGAGGAAGGDGYFALEELMLQQSGEAKAAE